MRNRLKKAMIVVLVIQMILVGIAIFSGKAIQSLSGEYLTRLENHVLLRKNYLEDEMLKYGSSLAEFEHYIQREVKEREILYDRSLAPELLEEVLESTVLTLRRSGATEVFIILEGETSHNGFYLRDLDPTFNDIDNSDILMERGSIELAKKINIPLDSQWSQKFNLEKGERSSDFYYKPFQAAKMYRNLESQDLAYWSKPFRLSPDDVEIITYSIPLRDEKGSPYGVIGVGLTLDFLASKLNYDELIANKRGAYLLSISDLETGHMEEVAYSGPIYKMFADSKLKFVKRQEDLKPYNSNAPFERDKWRLTGFVEEKVLFKPIQKIVRSIIMSLIISLLIGIIVVYIASSWFMKPLNKLMKNVTNSNPSSPFKPIKTNVAEIDELGLAMETLNKEVLNSASKVSQIINMVNVPLGVFEYQLSQDKAFCTLTVFKILGINHDRANDYVKASYLKEIINKIIKEPVIDRPNIYEYQNHKGKIIWVELIMEKQKDKVLGVIEDVSREILLQRKTEYERDHDVLTQILNRRAFEVQVKEKLAQGLPGHSAFVMWDLDNLKYINDTYGHEYGDQYIQKAALILDKFTVCDAIVARMSGDEFYTFIYGYSNKKDILKIVDEIKESLQKAYLKVPDGHLIRVRASAGIAWYPDDSLDYDQLIRYSDFAMYEVKNKDKGSVLEFSKETYNKNSILLYGKEELNRLIDKRLVSYAFQPIVDARTGLIFAYEALMRPQTKHLKSPYDVIRLARSQSKLYEIERLTWFGAMADFEKQKNKFKDAKLFINSIPNYVLSDQDISILEKTYAKDLDRIVAEITENEQSDHMCTRIKQRIIAKWGGHLALDDFGSGYSGELSLLILCPKYVKIDMDIIRGIDTDENRQKLLKNILSYAENRGIKIIAEGVETKGEMNKLMEFGVDYMQGYYLGKPHMIPQALDLKIKEEIQSFKK